MRLSQKPSARRRRRNFLITVAVLVLACLAVMFLRRPDPALAYAQKLGFNTTAAAERSRVVLPGDLTQSPYDSYLSASRAAGYDFAGFGGQEVTQVRLAVGKVMNTDQGVYLNIYLSGRHVVGVFLTGVTDREATPVNAPELSLDPL